PFTIHAAVAPLHLHSFPTRRSSDLAGLALSGCMRATTYQAAPEATLKPNDKAQLAKARYAVVPPAEPFRRAIVDYRRRELPGTIDRKSTRLNSSHRTTSYAVFCLKK